MRRQAADRLCATTARLVSSSRLQTRHTGQEERGEAEGGGGRLGWESSNIRREDDDVRPGEEIRIGGEGGGERG